MPATLAPPVTSPAELESDACYLAMKAHDARFDGSFFTAVTSTGIYCRPVCRVKLPRRENCRFYQHAAQAEAAGFRPCLRCRPQGAQADAHPVIARLTAALAQDPDHRWSEGCLTRMGLDPSTVRRLFRQHFGQSFLQMARAARLRQGMGRLNQGGRMIDAQLDSGFDSASGFR
ncbi:MAG: helix-turn-helix domain-containing protein, partial [Gammaproteobacteria bacterium]|nr:helix-turn-helix domain-containing protein [Gammaproteobacteria bacterium]